ncbi:hypothetical protein R3P38DRAFT_3204665 [Favolaschia claudopus]|uniref:Uncharacterized protein n=1 Tax=Favolaschia claudopus TaxID=2862362 RepID=A0AAW0APZ8_9AGAR
MVHVRTGGEGNLKNHKRHCKGPETSQKLTNFFTKKRTSPLVPSTVSTAPLVSPNATKLQHKPDAPAIPTIAPESSPSLEAETPDSSPIHLHDNSGCLPDALPVAEQNSISALRNLRLKMEQIPLSIKGDRLLDFSRNPAKFYAKFKSQSIEESLHTTSGHMTKV